MSAERASAVASALTMIALLAAICATALVRHPPAREPARLPAAACEPWMADALPGVGRKTRDATAAEIRAGDLAKLPPAARTKAREWFDFRGDSRGIRAEDTARAPDVTASQP